MSTLSLLAGVVVDVRPEAVAVLVALELELGLRFLLEQTIPLRLVLVVMEVHQTVLMEQKVMIPYFLPLHLQAAA